LPVAGFASAISSGDIVKSLARALVRGIRDNPWIAKAFPNDYRFEREARQKGAK
jgi:hypothetical protein